VYSHVYLLRYAPPARVADKQDQDTYKHIKHTIKMSGGMFSMFSRSGIDFAEEVAAADEARAAEETAAATAAAGSASATKTADAAGEDKASAAAETERAGEESMSERGSGGSGVAPK